MNALFHNDKIAELNDYFFFAKRLMRMLSIFGDPCCINGGKRSCTRYDDFIGTLKHLQPIGTLVTIGDVKEQNGPFLHVKLIMDAILEIKENAEVEIEVQVHGMTNMFQSKRSLLGHYFEYQGKVMEIENRKLERNMFLHDKERENKYPIFEDENGTHIMSPNDHMYH